MSIQQTTDTAQATLQDFEDTSLVELIQQMDKPHTSGKVLRAMYWGAGMSLREIADRFDVNHYVIHKQMKRHGIETRSKQEGEELRKLRDGSDMYTNEQSGRFGRDNSDTSKWSFQD